MADADKRTELSDYIGLEISITTAPEEGASGVLKSAGDNGIIIVLSEMWLKQGFLPTSERGRLYFFPWSAVKNIALPR